jgi:methyl-accepting chemotaxis protein
MPATPAPVLRWSLPRFESSLKTPPNSRSRLRTEVTNAMEEQAAGGQQVLQGLSQINEITDQVKTGSDEMQAGSQSVAEQMNRLRELSMEVGRAMQEIGTGTSEIENGVSELQSTSLENHGIVQRLAEEAKQFKT